MDGVGFILLSPNQDIYAVSHSSSRPGSHPGVIQLLILQMGKLVSLAEI